jgi:predicted AlkP superfamily phosphohydrolase/phosphomutase
MWYQPRWREMSCFMLPSISHGYVRVNVEGRESEGMVPAAGYGAFCEELSQQLLALRDARTGKRLVKEIVRTRQSALEDDARLPDADLVVFYEQGPVDVVDSPSFGRIGPIPYARTGGHANRGFAILKAPGCEAGSTLTRGHVRDLAPTILALLGAPIPGYLDGKPLIAADERCAAAQ